MSFFVYFWLLKGLARLNPHCSKQAQPITPMILCYILTKLDLNNPCDATFWCLFLHVFFLMLRKSNLVPNSVSSFKPEKQLSRKNIVYDKEKNILLITIKWSKTIQFGETFDNSYSSDTRIFFMSGEGLLEYG
jgi:hypothetical protein